MLKDKKRERVEILEITEEVWKKIIQETLHGVLTLLESAEKLLDNGGNEAICAGLYTYAVEEYGKILLLKQCIPSNGKVEINRNWFRGSYAHKIKFESAVNNLPPECIVLSRGLFDPSIFDPEIFDTEHVIADFEARTGVFYCDFLDSGNDIKPVPQVDKELLKKAIRKLQMIALGT